MTTDKIEHFYTDIDLMSIERYRVFSMYLVKESAIGSGVGTIEGKFSEVFSALQKNNTEEVRQCLVNLYQTFFYNYVGFSNKSMAIAALWKGNEDLSEEALSKVKIDLTIEQLETIKKKFLTSVSEEVTETLAKFLNVD